MLRIYALSILLASLLFSTSTWAEKMVPLDAPKAAPDTVFYSYDRGELRLSDFKGKVLIVNFWATWCTPCIVEMPDIHQLYAEYKDQGLEVLAISEDFGGFDVILPFLGSRNLPHFEALHDKRNALLRDFGLGSALPASLLIDKKGNIVGSVLGVIDWHSNELKSWIEELLAEEA